jgi:hypothetical protein
MPVGSTIPFGPSPFVVTVTATDGAGNTSTATFRVRVVDTTPPALTVHDLYVEATSAAGAVVSSYTNVSVTDAVGPVTLSYTTPPGSSFGFGPTSVTVTATDGWGNMSSATFNVIVRDTTAPVITLASSYVLVSATSSTGAIVTYAPATATDAVSAVTITYSADSGTFFTRGWTQVTVTATDAVGNVSRKIFWVLVS